MLYNDGYREILDHASLRRYRPWVGHHQGVLPSSWRGIQVTSTAGMGSTFSMHIPTSLPNQVVEPAEDVSERETKQIVLVIDDDGSQRDLLAKFLEKQGFAVRTAADGLRGLELARTFHPTAILLDVMMPQMDGWGVLTADIPNRLCTN